MKLTYKDKDTRIAAETNLRKLCKVSCSVPYHSSLRDEIRKAVESFKAKHKGVWVQARPDPENMVLRISVKDEDNKWHNDVERVPLTEAVLDLTHKVSLVKYTATATEVNGGGEQTMG